MRRWLMIGALVVVGSYIVGYRFLPWGRADRFRNAEVLVHTREFSHEWEARLFYPAAYVEWLLIRGHPQPWLPHPSWSAYPQVLLLEGDDWKATFPRNAFRKT
jgi:hypothetical protein